MNYYMSESDAYREQDYVVEFADYPGDFSDMEPEDSPLVAWQDVRPDQRD